MIEVAQFIAGATGTVFYFTDVGSRLFWLHWVTAALCTYVVLKSYVATTCHFGERSVGGCFAVADTGWVVVLAYRAALPTSDVQPAHL